MFACHFDIRNLTHETGIITVCVSVCLSSRIVARQRLGRPVPVSMNPRNSRRIVERVVFYSVRDVSQESRPLVLPRTFCLLMVYLTMLPVADII
jgi:hypothetical protein